MTTSKSMASDSRPDLNLLQPGDSCVQGLLHAGELHGEGGHQGQQTQDLSILAIRVQPAQQQ